jgi:hypothetical protein
MSIDFRETPDAVSGKGGAFRNTAGATISIQAACREVYLQSCASNISAVRVSIYPTTAADGVGLVIPMAVASIPGGNYLTLPVATLTILSTFSNVASQGVEILWRA